MSARTLLIIDDKRTEECMAYRMLTNQTTSVLFNLDERRISVTNDPRLKYIIVFTRTACYTVQPGCIACRRLGRRDVIELRQPRRRAALLPHRRPRPRRRQLGDQAAHSVRRQSSVPRPAAPRLLLPLLGGTFIILHSPHPVQAASASSAAAAESTK